MVENVVTCFFGTRCMLKPTHKETTTYLFAHRCVKLLTAEDSFSSAGS